VTGPVLAARQVQPRPPVAVAAGWHADLDSTDRVHHRAEGVEVEHHEVVEFDAGEVRTVFTAQDGPPMFMATESDTLPEQC
jgi:hypothetical protein